MWLLNWSEETLGTHQTDATAKKPNINPKEITAMRIRKLSMALTTLITVGALLQRPARADEEKETTTITFSAPFEIPGRILPAGSYIFQRVDDNDFRNVVQIISADHTVLYAMLQTRPVDRMNPTANPSITLAKQGSGNPDVLVRWFYGGNLTGHQFVYPRAEAKELTQAKLDTFVGGRLVNGAQVAGE
jgi:hypothetical protein